MRFGGFVTGASASACFLLIVFAGSSSAEAACDVTSAGLVSCSQDTNTSPTTNKNGADPSSNSRTQLFNNGNPISAVIGPEVTIEGAGIALVDDGNRRIALTNNGAIVANESTQGGLLLTGTGGALTYIGTGSVLNTTGPAVFARNSGDITLTAEGNVTGGAPGMPVNGLTPTPAGIEADVSGAGNVVVGGSGDVISPGGRGLIAEEGKNGWGSVLVTGTGNVAGQGRICPGVNFNRGLMAGKVGCSGIRAVIDNNADSSNVTVNRSGNVMGTSTAINAITLGKGNVAVTTGQTAQIVGSFEFGIEAMAQGHGSTGRIAVTTGSGGTLSSGGDGIFAANLANHISAGAKSTIVVHAAGQIVSGSFPPASRNSKNPTGMLAGISAGYIGGTSAQPNPNVDGSVFVDNAALITARTGDGILGYNFGAGSITVVSGTSVTALAGDGIVTQATTGPTRIAVMGVGTTVQGNGSGNAALTGRSTGGEIDVQVGTGATLRGVDGAVGLSMQGTRSVKAIDNFGTIVGGFAPGSGPPTRSTDGAGIVGANLNISNNGAIIGGALNGGALPTYAIVLTGGINSIASTGSIVGGVNVSGNSTFMPALPGSVIGMTLAINGPLRFASTATYQIRLTQAAVDSATTSGAAALHGADLAVDAMGAAPVSGTRYTILTAAGGIPDRFSGVTSNLAFFRPVLTYEATGVVLTSQYNYLLSARPQNQISVGAALNTAAAQARPGVVMTIFRALENVQTLQESAALDSLIGEGTTAAQSSAHRASQLFTSSIFDQTTFYESGAGNSITLTDAPPAFTALRPIHELADLPRNATTPTFEPTRTWRAWGSGFGGVENIHGNSTIGSAAQNNDIYGGVIGVDYQLTPNYLAGIAIGGSDGEFSVPSRTTAGSTTGGHIAFYDIATFGSFYGASSNSFSYFTNRTTRVAGGFGSLASETERGNFDSDEFRTRLEFGRHFDAYGVTPFVALELAELRSNGLTESAVSGAGLLALDVSGQSAASVPAYAGARVQRVTPLGSGMVLLPTLELAYVHEFAPYRSQIASIADLPGSTFLVDGARPGRNSAHVKTGGELTIGPRSAIFANFDGEFSGADQFYAGKGGFKYVW